MGLKESNEKLAWQISQENLLTGRELEKTLEECNAKGTHLGQELVKRRYLQMSDIVRLMKNIGKTTASQSSGGGGEIQGTFGEYQVLDEIARGGMGIVYRARQSGLDRLVALKVLLSGALSNASQVQRFLREAKVIAGLDHPNVIPLYNMGEHDGHHYFTMKCVEGGTYSDMIKKDLPLKEKIATLTKICYALDHAHKQKVLHRDIKPSNILLDKDGTPYLTDFGLAKVVDSRSALTQTGSVLGTPFYMAPEQVTASKDIDHRCDIYAMGIILYQTITGELPFNAEIIAELHRKITEEEPPPPSALVRDVPKNLEAICLMAIDKKVQNRYQTALIMAEDLERYLQDKKPIARKLRLGPTFFRFYRRKRQMVHGLLVTVALVLLSIVGRYWWQQRGEKQAVSQVKITLEANKICDEAERLFSEGQYINALKLLHEKAKTIDHYKIYLTLGRFYHRLDKNKKAKKYFEKTENQNNTASDLLYHQAIFFLAIGDTDTALKFAEKYINANPKSAAGYRQRAQIWRALSNAPREKADIDLANALENKQLAKELNTAEKLSQKGRVDEALALFDKLLEENPDYELAYLARAKIYQNRKEWNQALKDISLAIELNPKPAYLFLKGQWLYQGDYPEEAYSFLSGKSVKGNKQILPLLSKLALELKDYQKAYDYNQKLLKNGDEQTLVNLGRAALAIKKFNEAEKYLREVVDNKSFLAPVRGEAYYFLGKLQIESDPSTNQGKAISFWLQTLKLKPRQKDKIHLLLGRYYFKEKQYKKAGPFLSKASKVFKNDALLYWQLSFTCRQLLKKWNKKPVEQLTIKERNKRQKIIKHNTLYRKRAIEALSRCLELEPWHAKYYLERGILYSELEELEKAQKDLLTYMELKPENMEAMIYVLDNMFREGLVTNYYNLSLIFQNYNNLIAQALMPDLFQEEWDRLGTVCMKSAIEQKKSGQDKQWDIKQTNTLLKGLIFSNSRAVHEMAYTGLRVRYRDQYLWQIIREEQNNKKYLPAARRRLKKLEGILWKSYLKELKVEFRQLLIRIYRANDTKALAEIFGYNAAGHRCLQSLLADNNENVMIRFLAAKALYDLQTVPAYKILIKNILEGKNEKQLFSVIVFRKKDHFPIDFSSENKFARAMAARYAPATARDFLKRSLQDPALEVRLYAAQRLHYLGDDSSSTILENTFHHQKNSAAIRSFALFTYWDFASLKKRLNEEQFLLLRQRAEKKLHLLEIAAEDPAPQVRRIAITMLAKYGTNEHQAKIGKRVRDKDQEKDALTRYRGINTLARQMVIKPILPILLDGKEPLLFRLAVVDGLVVATQYNVGRQVPPGVFLEITRLFRDPDPRIRIAVVMILLKVKDKAGKFVINYMKKNNSDFAVRAGYVLAMINSPQIEYLPYLHKAIDDESDLVRPIAASAIIQIAKKFDVADLAQIHEKVKSKPERRAAAMGYVKLVHDRVNKNIGMTGELQKFNTERLYIHFIHNLILKARNYPDKVDKFIDLYDRALDMAPGNDKIWFERGLMHYMKKNYRKSILDIEQAIAIEAIDFYKIWLARIYFLNGQPEAALAISQKKPYLFHTHPDLCLLQSKILRANHLDKQALAWEEDMQLQNKLSEKEK